MIRLQKLGKLQTLEKRIVKPRIFFPKNADPSLVTDVELKHVVRMLNDRLVRKLNCKTPNQLLREKIPLIS